MSHELENYLNAFNNIPAELDTSVEIDHLLDFTLQSIERNYGFEGIGIQIVDYEKKKIRFYKLHTPSLTEDLMEKLGNFEIPLDPTGGVCFVIVQQNQPVYFEDIKKMNLEFYYVSSYDLESIKLLQHRTHLIIPVTFDEKVIALIHLSSYTRVVHLKTDDIDKLKVLAINIGRVFYKTLYFKKVYQENQKLIMDVIKAREARENLLAGINHELKTPLSAIIGFSQYLTKIKNSESIEKVKEIANIIHKNGNYLLSIIHEIIELYKIASGKIEIDWNEVNIPSLISGVVESLYPLYTARKQTVTMEVENIEIKSDYKRLHQIFYNLVSNSIKYTQDKGKIVIQAKRDERGVVFSVQDNGIGMDKDDLANLFQPFKRGKTSYKEEEGSGLGLYITNELVKILEGKIEVESQVKKGSTFRILLPLAK